MAENSRDRMTASENHNELACMGLTWLRNKITGKGMRGTTEVCLDIGYVADAVVLCSFQSRYYEQYCKASDLKPLVYNRQVLGKRVNYTESEGIVNYFACVFEAKATRSDWLNTFGASPNHQNRHKPIGSLHWCVTPRKLIDPNELPDFWGLLEEYGAGLREVKKPRINTEAQLDKIAHTLIWPLQAVRNLIICQRCGRWTRIAYCSRCLAKDEQPITSN